ncbi:bifunctional folylpolyglutamate synthase/dihydrofolate synthase [Arachidicoccus terrestris]|uniref:bifunctional folylpolyglutamate synthase/dihydrofolate synthase n=1 Tax=Arachidicoccus terrestris TaxID=2875539 RepID=UPI001CC499E7|nr:folylpolyglutamate synthase/dihydrofolate synthase family protein [Arachidicoccus terrestris]UAY54560.1 bifunctional folylpolyglutamate synthase/dihydrofolate synthase [Arachidicoccus terrestris]
MDYSQTIEFLYAQLPMFSRDGASAFKKDLSNTWALCEALGQPQNQFKSIHIAGTNGKGSSSHMLAAIMQEAGYKTGLYTSPHLYDFRERIRINGTVCTEEFVIRFVEKIQPLLPVIQPSFFEITVAMAFDYFAEQKVDIAIIETGLGGRLDSTNVILPELSLITNISWDHMQFLGDTLPQIAGEKAGIIKEGRPVVVSEYITETKPVFESVSAQKHADLFFVQDLWTVTSTPSKRDTGSKESLLKILATRHADVSEQDDQKLSGTYQLDLTGNYQVKNVGGVLETVFQMRRLGWNIAGPAVKRALKTVKPLTGIAGRWDEVSARPWIITDVGHNVDGIRMIRQQLSLTGYKKLHVITGFVKDKDVAASLKELPKAALYYFTQAPIPRALDALQLASLAAGFGLSGEAYPNMEMALRSAISHYREGDLILVCGSVFLVAEVRGALQRLQFP